MQSIAEIIRGFLETASAESKFAELVMKKFSPKV
jgi:hypothetical protein